MQPLHGTAEIHMEHQHHHKNIHKNTVPQFKAIHMLHFQSINVPSIQLMSIRPGPMMIVCMISNQWSLFTNGGTSCWDYLAHKPTAALKKKKTRQKHITNRYLWSFSMQAHTPPTQKKKPVSSTSNRHKLNNYMTIWSKKSYLQIHQPPKTLPYFNGSPWSPDGVGWLDRQSPAVHHFFQIQSSPGELFLWVSPCISFGRMGSPTKKTWRQEKYEQQKHQFNSSCNSLYIVYDSIVYTCTVHIT